MQPTAYPPRSRSSRGWHRPHASPSSRRPNPTGQVGIHQQGLQQLVGLGHRLLGLGVRPDGVEDDDHAVDVGFGKELVRPGGSVVREGCFVKGAS